MPKNTREYDREYGKKRRKNESPKQAEERKAKNLKRYHETKTLTGGKPGMKPLIEGDPTEARTITLPESFWAWVKEYGGGKYSRGLFRLVEEAKEKKR